MAKEITFNNGRVERHFTADWAKSGIINIEKIPELVTSLVEQRKSMLEYIEALHDKMDYIMQHNKICDVAGCLSANCSSDHK